MRLSIQFAPACSPIPIHYHAALQGALYDAMDPEVFALVHDKGFVGRGHTFRLFTFSRLMGRYQIRNGCIAFPQGCELVVSSPVSAVLEGLVGRLTSHPSLTISASTLSVVGIKSQSLSIPSGDSSLVIIDTLSPLTVHRTIPRTNGRPYTRFYPPQDPEFSGLVRSNLVNKRASLPLDKEFSTNDGETEFAIHPIRVRRHIVRYGKLVLEAYGGQFAISGDRDLIQLGVDAGFGSNNAQGFGCVTIRPSKERVSC